MLIPTSKNIKTITDMREKALELLEEVKKQGVLYLFQHSNPQAVMLSMEEFERVCELLEDHLDQLEATNLTREKRGKGITLSQIILKHQKKVRV